MDEDIEPKNKAAQLNPAQDVRMAEEYQLSDIIDTAELKLLLDNYCNSVGIAAAILNLKGDVLVASHWQRICTDFHRVNKTTGVRCLESDTELALHLDKGEHFSLYKCKNGMTDAASPIIVEGRHLGNVFVGQFLLAPPDREYFGKQAQQFGFDESSYFKALDEVLVPCPACNFALNQGM